MKSFKFAFEGLRAEFIKGRNFKIQIACGILVIIFGLVFKLNSNEWVGVMLVINLVLILELINTSLEQIVDLVSPEIHPGAKLAKDVAAAAVLVSSLTSLAIGGFIFIPKLVILFR